MKKTFVDVMLELPVDATLRDFLPTHGLPVPGGFAWDDTPETSQFLVEAIKVWPDAEARDRMLANLNASVQLGDAAGKQALFEAAVDDAAALSGLALCSSAARACGLCRGAGHFAFQRQHVAHGAAIGPRRHGRVGAESRLFTSASCNAATAAWPIWSRAHPVSTC